MTGPFSLTLPVIEQFGSGRLLESGGPRSLFRLLLSRKDLCLTDKNSTEIIR